jgi:alpha-glucosidase
VIARRKGEEWFIGGINGEQPGTFRIDFSFLNSSIQYMASIYSDDSAVNTRTHVRIDRMEIDRSSSYDAKLNVNNGFAMHIKPKH